ncbi:hypothetical protein SRABI128_03838 [Microbacterium sp. Bi128]|nr:hypothetical protein SRABI128_03838 [Microbacterium sp. Bi128]
MDVVVPKSADSQLDPGQGRAQVVGNGPEDGGAHRVALGQAQHLPPARHQLLSFQLRCQMNPERPQKAPVACGQNPSEQHQARGGVDFFDVVAGGIASGPVSGQGRNFTYGGLETPLPVRAGSAVAVREAVAQAENSSTTDLEDAQGLFQQCLDRVLRAGGTARQVTERRGFGAGPRGLLGAAGR